MREGDEVSEGGEGSEGGRVREGGQCGRVREAHSFTHLDLHHHM